MKLNEAPLILSGLDGANPLAFLAAIGTASVANQEWPDLRISWQSVSGVWRPVLAGCGQDEEVFLAQLYPALRDASMAAFDIDNKLPYPVQQFVGALKQAARIATIDNRRDSDFLTAFGTEMNLEPGSKKDAVFRDTSFRMVRSGDSKGQGLPYYAKAIRQSTGIDHLRRTLFRQWDYKDTSFSLRWDPVEDQRYALVWDNPNDKSKKAVKFMIGANSLAIEALQYFPTLPVDSRRVETTGFHRSQRKRIFFTWPIWATEVELTTVQSLLSLSVLRADPVPRQELKAMGIVEVFRAQRIQQNQYYSNFAPSCPA